MHHSNIFAALACAGLFQETSAQGKFIPWPPGHDNSLDKREIQNLTIYSLNFNTPEDAPIYRFESTLVIPKASPQPPEGALAAIWPGLQNQDLLQNVLTNQRIGGARPAEWNFLPFYCCHPAGNFSNEIQVYPGDALTTQYLWDIPHNKYVDSWSVVTATEGAKAGKSGFTGGTTYDQKIATEGKGGPPYYMASLAVEVQGMGLWDWGPFTWKNIIIMAKTKEQDWCTKVSKGSKFSFNTSTPVATTDGNLTTCYIARLVFLEPTDHRFEPNAKSSRN
jgi:hypothetical protein